jgi:filamentous hemagglutinin
LAILATTFAFAWKRSDHWYDHHEEFPEIADEIEYERCAAEFLNAPLSPTMVEGVRRCDGDTIRYDRATQNFAVMQPDGTIRTFFRPSKSWHGFSSNLEYFQKECAK